jgi:hypothetical protein
MVRLRINLTERSELIIQRVMEKYNLKTRSKAIELMLEQYQEKIMVEPSK